MSAPKKGTATPEKKRRTAESAATSTPGPVGYYGIQNAIARALQPLELLEWALAARLESGETETFQEPLVSARSELLELLEKIRAHGLGASTPRQIAESRGLDHDDTAEAAE